MCACVRAIEAKMDKTWKRHKMLTMTTNVNKNKNPSAFPACKIVWRKTLLYGIKTTRNAYTHQTHTHTKYEQHQNAQWLRMHTTSLLLLQFYLKQFLVVVVVVVCSCSVQLALIWCISCMPHINDMLNSSWTAAVYLFPVANGIAQTKHTACVVFITICPNRTTIKSQCVCVRARAREKGEWETRPTTSEQK